MNLASEPASSGLATRRVANRGPASGMAVHRKNRRVTRKNRLPAAPRTPVSTVVRADVSLAGSSWSTAVVAGPEPMPWLVRKSVPSPRRLRASSAYCGSRSTSLAMASAVPSTSTRTIAQAATRASSVAAQPGQPCPFAQRSEGSTAMVRTRPSITGATISAPAGSPRPSPPPQRRRAAGRALGPTPAGCRRRAAATRGSSWKSPRPDRRPDPAERTSPAQDEARGPDRRDRGATWETARLRR